MNTPNTPTRITPYQNPKTDTKPSKNPTKTVPWKVSPAVSAFRIRYNPDTPKNPYKHWRITDTYHPYPTTVSAGGTIRYPLIQDRYRDLRRWFVSVWMVVLGVGVGCQFALRSLDLRFEGFLGGGWCQTLGGHAFEGRS